ncbi:MAG: hypothetical protein K2G32_00515, partial [Oscillospiraceae bacterium]|nr:hypothetical protein [Oscillospiraceae bacterium]
MAGCSLSDGSDISVNETESFESASEEISQTRGEVDNAPAGVSSPERSSYAQTDPNGGVSLVKGEFDDIMEMVSFEGEFVPFEELGYEQYMTYPQVGTQPSAVDNELLFFFEYRFMGDTGPTGEKNTLLNVYEYNLLTDTSECIAMPDGCISIMYIDREYIIYGGQDVFALNPDVRFYQINRASGEIIDVTDPGIPFRIWGYGNFVRCGDYLFFTRVESMETESGGYDEAVELLVRYSFTRNVSEVVKAAELLGAVGEEVIIAPFGSRLENMHYTLSSVSFDFSPDQLYLGGEQIGYVVPTDRNTIFGEKYEVGRLLPSSLGNIYKPVLTTNYGTTVEEFLLTEKSVAAVRVIGDTIDSAEILIVDTKNKRAAAVPKYGDETTYGYIMCDGDWIYFSYYGYDRI